jgi:MoaA/NifB/PqqE/SkfB family radical SAM enzyme
MAKSYQQEPPFAIQVELTEGCNLRCGMCGIQGIRDAPGGYKYMTPAIAQKVAGDIAKAGWNSRIEFAMHGEPSINPSRNTIISIFRKELPHAQIMMTSNGSGFVKNASQQISNIMDAGLNILALDDYKGIPFVPKIREQIDATPPDIDDVYDYPKDSLDASPHRRWPKNTRVLIYIEDINDANSGSHSKITNHCGAGSPPNDRGQGKRCAKPFRELSIRWDGTVAGCCNDWRGIYKIGDASRVPVYELWNNAAFTAMRRKLYHGQRDFGACRGCDYTTYRNGLLPDKLGKQTLSKPTPDDFKAIQKATSGSTLTQIVLRPWEGGAR